jgi:hypothetical protein
MLGRKGNGWGGGGAGGRKMKGIGKQAPLYSSILYHASCFHCPWIDDKCLNYFHIPCAELKIILKTELIHLKRKAQDTKSNNYRLFSRHLLQSEVLPTNLYYRVIFRSMFSSNILFLTLYAVMK